MEKLIDIQENQPIRKAILAGYGSGFFGYGFVTQMFGAYFVFYSTSVLHLKASLIGLLIALGIVWDAVSDPVMGYISDNTRTKYGRRHIYIIVGALLLAFFNLLLWQVPMGLSPLVKMIVIGVLIFLFKTCVTIFVTPYSALGAELSDDYHERVKIQAVKTVFFLMALVLVSAICMFVFFRPRPGYPIGQLNPSAYSEMAVTGSIIMILTGLWTYHSTKAYKHKKSQQERYDIRTSFVSSFKNADFRQVFLGYLTTNTASAIISGVGLHTFTYTFLMTNVEIGIIFGVQFLVSIITQPFWASVSKKIDKKKTVLVCLIIAMIGTLMLLGFVYNRDFVRLHPMSMVIYAITVGFGTSGLYSIPLAMVADTVDMEEYKNGYRCEGMFYGLLNFGYKIAQSIAILLLGVLLDVIGFDPNVYIQTSATEFRLGALLAIGSMVAFMLSFIAYKSYSLNYDIVTDIQEKLAFKQV